MPKQGKERQRTLERKSKSAFKTRVDKKKQMFQQTRDKLNNVALNIYLGM